MSKKDPSALGILIYLLVYSVIAVVIFAFFWPVCSILIVTSWIVGFVAIQIYDKRHWRKPGPDSHGIWLSAQTRNLEIGDYAVKGTVMASCVKARNIFSAARADMRSLVGGEAQQYTSLVEETRNIALARMCQKAKKMGCNGVLGFRMISAQTIRGATEIVAYGTAVKIRGVGRK